MKKDPVKTCWGDKEKVMVHIKCTKKKRKKILIKSVEKVELGKKRKEH